MVWKGSKEVLCVPSLGKIHSAQSSCMLAMQLTEAMLVWLIICGSICFGAPHLLSPSEAPSAVLCPVLGSPVQER